MKRSLVRNFVVPAPKKLHKTKAVAEWINHQCQATPFVSSYFSLKASAGVHCLPNGVFNFWNDEVEVHRGPMTLVAAELASGAGGRCACSFDEQVNRP